MYRSHQSSTTRLLLTFVCSSCVLAALRAETAVSETATPIVQPSLTVTGEFWHNASGGLATGSRWNSLVDLGATVDFAQIGGPAGSSLTAQLFWIENQYTAADFGDLTGAANPVSGLHAGDAWRVFNLFYRQTWDGERLALKVGQLAIDDDFMGSDYAGLFAFSALGAMPSQVATGHCGSLGGGCAYPIYAVAAPGLHLAASLTETLSAQLGLYHGGPGRDQRTNHGFDWDDGAGQGVVVFYEGAYSFSLLGRASTIRAGGAVHTGRFDDYSRVAADEAVREVRGLYSFYLIQDVVLAARDAEHPLLGAFWRAGLSPQHDRSAVRIYGDAGLNWFGPLPSRPADTLGLAVSYMEYGDHYRRLDPALAAAETALELTYRAQVTDRLALQAIVQRHFNPLAATDGARHASSVLALRAELSF